MDLSQAATSAAQATSTMIHELQGGKGSGHQRFGDGAKPRTPDIFETDDPVRYTLWREQFLNWLTFCDSRYGDLIQHVENWDVHTSGPHIQDLSSKLYSILASYLCGPALQVVTAFAHDRHGFAVWHQLKGLYAPRALQPTRRRLILEKKIFVIVPADIVTTCSKIC